MGITVPDNDLLLITFQFFGKLQDRRHADTAADQERLLPRGFLHGKPIPQRPDDRNRISGAQFGELLRTCLLTCHTVYHTQRRTRLINLTNTDGPWKQLARVHGIHRYKLARNRIRRRLRLDPHTVYPVRKLLLRYHNR